MFWPVPLLYVLWGIRRSTRLRTYVPARGADVPRVTVIIPARDEALNIGRCVASVLASTYANLEVIIVDDHSSDDTGAIARRLVEHDARARVTVPPPLPAGWYGKQWACAHAASLATGDLLLFTDADTDHAPDLAPRAVRALTERHADLLTVVGRQETVTFWERAVQPAVFLSIMLTMGNSEAMSASRNPKRKAANGQFLLMRRAVYDAEGGHERVRAYVAEDIMFAHTWTARGRAVHILLAEDLLATRMYRSLGDIIRGWSKNVWAGTKHLLPQNRIARGLGRISLPFMPLIGLLPHALIALALAGIVSREWLWPAVAAYVLGTIGLYLVFTAMRLPRSSALLHPLGCAMSAYIFALAALRGDRTEWKGRLNRAA
ncbi:MAG TPA: glycosyltransferase family 2 protein [Gemmatimonadaceae bacterium]|nr:glycosyltransferase family 2 protein [Gemmatimonadaceae bacterium]